MPSRSDPPAQLDRLRRDTAGWASPLRDLGAASLALWAVFIGEILLLLLPTPPEVLLALPGVLAAWWIFGAPSAVFALLVAAAVVHFMAAGRVESALAATPGEALGPFLVAVVLVAACVALRLRAQGQDSRKGLDTRLEQAMHQAATTQARLAAAEADAAAAHTELALARAKFDQLQRGAQPTWPEVAWPADGGINSARRTEGGI